MPRVTREVTVPNRQAALIWDGLHKEYSVEFGCSGVTNLREYEIVIEICGEIKYLHQKKHELQAIANVVFA